MDETSIMTKSLMIAFSKPYGFFLVVVAVYVATASYGGLASKDTFTAAVASWALATRHTINLGFIPLVHSPASGMWIVRGVHGAFVSNRFPGAILLAAPLYALAGASFSLVPAGLTAAIAGAAAAAVLLAVLRRLLPAAVALAGASLFAFASSNWTVAGRELWEHSGSDLLISVGMLLVLRRRWGWAGLCFGATILFRAHLGVTVPVIGVGLVLTERRWRPPVIFVLGAGPGLVAYLAWNWLVYGRLTIVGGYTDVGGGQGPLFFLENVAGTFVSLERGILVASPLLILAALGLADAWRVAAPQTRMFALAGLGYLSVQLWLIRFSGGDGFFGYRTCLEAVVLATPLLVEGGALAAKRVPSVVCWMLAGLSVTYFTSAMFVPHEVLGSWSPWSTWMPIVVAQQYGSEPVVLGAVIGVLAVAVCWAVPRASARRSVAAKGPGTSAGDHSALPA